MAGLSETISTRGQRIDALDFDEAQPPAANGRATG
jgi:hypothetical protein